MFNPIYTIFFAPSIVQKEKEGRFTKCIDGKKLADSANIMFWVPHLCSNVSITLNISSYEPGRKGREGVITRIPILPPHWQSQKHIMKLSALPFLQQRACLTVEHMVKSIGCKAKLHGSEAQLYHLLIILHWANHLKHSGPQFPPLGSMDITSLTDSVWCLNELICISHH